MRWLASITNSKDINFTISLVSPTQRTLISLFLGNSERPRKSGMLQSMGSQRVRCGLVTEQQHWSIIYFSIFKCIKKIFKANFVVFFFFHKNVNIQHTLPALFLPPFFLIIPCSMCDLSSLTKDWTHAPCIGSEEFQQLDHQGSP